jgi:hypothetical protein
MSPLMPRSLPWRSTAIVFRSDHLGEKLNNHGSPSFLIEMTKSIAMMIDPKAKLLVVLDHAEEYRGLAIRAKDRGERESYARIVELYVEIAEELESMMD